VLTQKVPKGGLHNNAIEEPFWVPQLTLQWTFIKITFSECEEYKKKPKELFFPLQRTLMERLH